MDKIGSDAGVRQKTRRLDHQTLKRRVDGGDGIRAIKSIELKRASSVASDFVILITARGAGAEGVRDWSDAAVGAKGGGECASDAC